MNMKRIEAQTLEEAYKKASKEFNCSITEINYEIIQYPTTGVMGLFKKSAIIVAVRKISTNSEKSIEDKEPIEEEIKEELVKTIKEDSPKVEEKKENIDTKKDDKVLDSFFENSEDKNSKFDDDRDSPKN